MADWEYRQLKVVFKIITVLQHQIDVVADVSAMCSVERGSITASIEFDRYFILMALLVFTNLTHLCRPFSGKIYSIGFDNVHHCVYYNGFFTKQILFAIPVHGCGTRATQNTREVSTREVLHHFSARQAPTEQLYRYAYL